MQLRELLNGVVVKSLEGDASVQPLLLTTNSLQVVGGSLFIAVRGTQRDGHAFIADAIEKGALVVVSEEPSIVTSHEVVQVQVANSAEVAALIACNFYQQPSRQLKVVGVTGTNGKTTIATLLYKLFIKLGYTCGLISTVENRIGETVLPSTHTTPDAISLQGLLHQML